MLTPELTAALQQLTPILTLFVSAGGLKLLSDFIKDRRDFHANDRQFHATTQAELIKELNRIVEDERRRCSDQMALMQARINFLEQQVVQLQAASARQIP